MLPTEAEPPGAVFVGKVARINADGTVGVTLNAYGDLHEWPPARWVAAGQTPARGDTVLVLIDDAGDTWAFPAAPYAPPTVYFEGASQPGILAATDCALTVDSATQVTVAAGHAYVRNAAGLLVRTTPAATVLAAIPPASASNFRLDQVVESSAGVVTRLAGTQGLGVTLANRTDAAAIPAGSQLLHDILVTSAGVLIANVRDRRPWACGAYSRTVRNANAAAGNDYTTTSATFVEVDATNLKPRVECSGVPVKVNLNGAISHSLSNARIAIGPAIDGAFSDGAAGNGSQFIQHTYATATASLRGVTEWTFIPTPGSHQFSLLWTTVDGGTASLWARAAVPLELIVKEIVRPNANNGTT